MENELTVRPSTTPAQLLNIAIEKGADLEKLEKLMDLQLRYEQNEARKAYTVAMSNFKKNPPDIEKDRKVKYKTSSGETAYNHASLGNVTEKINSALGQHGLSAGWTTDQSDKGITVTCRITHIMGHAESTSLTAAPDTSGGKNNIQALGSTISYLERYSLLALTGLATHEMDDDGAVATEYISDEQKSTIVDYLSATSSDVPTFLKYLGCESIEKITAKDYQKAISALKAKEKRGAGVK